MHRGPRFGGGLSCSGRGIRVTWVRFFYFGLFVIAASVNAQPPDSLWSRTYGGSYWDVCNAVQVTSDGGFVLAGETESFGAGVAQWYVVKTDAEGDTVWTRMYGGNSWDECYSVEETTDGGFILGGYTHTYGAGDDDIWLVKTDGTGNTVWMQTFGGVESDYCYSVREAADGGYVIGGNTRSFGDGGVDFWLVKTDESGDSVWSRTYGGSSHDVCYSVIQTLDGGFALCGFTRSYGPAAPFGSNMWLVRTDDAGDTLWTRTFGGVSGSECNTVEQTSDGGFLLGGHTWSFGIGTPEYDNVYLVKTDSNGEVEWTQTLGGVYSDVCRQVRQTEDGGYILGGITSSFGIGAPAYSNAWVIRVDADGDSVWSCTFGGNNTDQCFSIIESSDGEFVVGGFTFSYGQGTPGYPNMWLMKVGTANYAEEPEKPTDYYLLESYPNPFNSATTVSFTVPISARVQLAVYDATGREVEILADESFAAGTHELTWRCEECTSGVYLLRMRSGDFQQAQRVMLLK